MEWKDIIKESRKDKDEVHTGGYGGMEQRRIKTSGGAGFDDDKFGRIKDSKEEDLDEDADNQMKDLLEMTLGDIDVREIHVR